MTEYFDLLKKYNFWSKHPDKMGVLRRTDLKRIQPFIGTRLVKVLVGQRRAGKSFLLRQLIDYLIGQGTTMVDGVRHYDFTNAILFWIGGSVVSLILASTLWRAKIRD